MASKMAAMMTSSYKLNKIIQALIDLNEVNDDSI